MKDILTIILSLLPKGMIEKIVYFRSQIEEFQSTTVGEAWWSSWHLRVAEALSISSEQEVWGQRLQRSALSDPILPARLTKAQHQEETVLISHSIHDGSPTDTTL